jgi:hypothetical protein
MKQLVFIQRSCCFSIAFRWVAGVKLDTLENEALMHGMDVVTLIKKPNQFIFFLPPNVKANHWS